MRRALRGAQSAGTGDSLQSVRHVCANGLVLLLLPKADLPIIAVEVFVPAGQSREPAAQAGVASLTGQMLSEGSRAHSGPEIAELIDSVGGELVTHSIGGSLEVRKQDLELGLGLLRECLFAPRFPAAELKKVRQQQLTGILAAQDSPQEVARLAFDAAVYRGHPYARPSRGYQQTVARLKRADCVAHHRAHFSPHQTVLSISGDFEAGALIERLDRSWGRLPVRDAPPVKITRVSRQRRKRTVRVPLARKQCHIYLGHLGIRRSDPDFYSLQVLDHILGMGAGFTDRLSCCLRDEQGLAYTVYASITASAQAEPGTFHAYIGTAPENEQPAIDGMLAEIARIRDTPVSAEELAGAKAYLTGSFAFKFETVRQLCGYMQVVERFKLGNYRADYPGWIERITTADVQRVARTHLNPEHVTLVVAGPERK